MNSEDFAINIVRDFITGTIDINDFMELFNESNQISDYLEGIIDNIEKNQVPIKRRTMCMKGVAQNKPFKARSNAEIYIKEYAQSFLDLSKEWKANPPKLGKDLRRENHLTAFGAYRIHSVVADVYYQVDDTLQKTEKYHNEYDFLLSVMPGYLSGGVDTENYVSKHILPKYPTTMKKSERMRLVKEDIRKVFKRDCKGYPRWIQSPEWPMDSDGKPMVYGGQCSFERYTSYFFRAVDLEETKIIKQWW